MPEIREIAGIITQWPQPSVVTLPGARCGRRRVNARSRLRGSFTGQRPQRVRSPRRRRGACGTSGGRHTSPLRSPLAFYAPSRLAATTTPAAAPAPRRRGQRGSLGANLNEDRAHSVAGRGQIGSLQTGPVATRRVTLGDGIARSASWPSRAGGGPRKTFGLRNIARGAT